MIAYIAIPAIVAFGMFACYGACVIIAHLRNLDASPKRQRVNSHGLRRSSGYWTTPDDAD